MKTSIPGWPFPVYGKMSVETKKAITPKTNVKSVVSSIQQLQKAKLKKFDKHVDALF